MWENNVNFRGNFHVSKRTTGAGLHISAKIVRLWHNYFSNYVLSCFSFFGLPKTNLFWGGLFLGATITLGSLLTGGLWFGGCCPGDFFLGGGHLTEYLLVQSKND